LQVAGCRLKDRYWIKTKNDTEDALALRGLSPARGTFGFDVLVYVGQAFFIRNRKVKEIVTEWWEKNGTIAEREIGYPGRKFIIYLALAHRESRERLNEALKRRDGLPPP